MTDKEKFSQALELVRSGVYIVTSSFRNQPAGCTCVWVSRVSFSPPLFAVSMDPGRHTFQTIERGKRFCINIMGQSGIETARKFGNVSGHDTKKFRKTRYQRSPGGSPVLDSAITYLDFKLVRIEAVGDHRMVIGELVHAEVAGDEAPLVYDPASFYLDQVTGQAMSQTG